MIAVRTNPTNLHEAEEALQRAQKGRAEVRKMGERTIELARAAERLLEENHLAERVRRSAAQ